MAVAPRAAEISIECSHSTAAPERTCPAWAEIDLDALARNYDRLKGLVGADRQIIVPVKANGYGHGATAVAQCLAGRGAYAVETASLTEALAIRESGNPVRIVAYPGNLAADVRTLLRNDITPTVVDLLGAQIVSRAALRSTAIHVKVDAGLGRLGLPLDLAEDIIMKMSALPNVTIEGLYTHVPFSDMGHAVWAESRVRAFEALVQRLLRRGLKLHVTQARASSHVVANIGDSLTAVCAGHFLYGLRPFSSHETIDFPAESVLRAIRARLIQVRSTASDETRRDGNPYGGNYQGVGRTGVLQIGRANGIRRPIRDEVAHALVAGRFARIISVSLEYTVIDLTGHPDVSPGDVATLLGEDSGAALHLERVAKHEEGSPLDFCIGLRDLEFRYRGGK